MPLMKPILQVEDARRARAAIVNAKPGDGPKRIKIDRFLDKGHDERA